MTIEEGPDSYLTTHHHLLDWIEDSISFLPSFLNEPYTAPKHDQINDDEWWNQDQDQDQTHLISAATSTDIPIAPKTISPPPLRQPEFSKKRKQPANKEDENRRKTGKKTQGKANAGNSSNDRSKELSWAEQLLNPCAIAIEAANLSRVQHLLYVLQELASPTGDPNHRLAAHGLRALTNHLSSTGIANGIGISGRNGVSTSPTFATTEPKLFRSALIKFHEVSPWFAFPNALANASILQTLTLDSSNQEPRALHIIDIGVSHGIQWPTLLDALTRRSGGSPPLVRLTVVGSTTNGPFSAAPPGYDFPSHLFRYAKSINLNLKIDRTETLDTETLALTRDQTLIVCAQFRAHQLNHDDRTSFLRSIKDLDPDLVVLSEIDGECGCERCGDFPAGFARRVEVLWRFLDSTSAAFKGKECVERRVVEGEAARVVETAAGGRREWWRERMLGLGFREVGFGEEAVESGRALLRKYDGNWEMRVVEEAVCLGWKGQPVSFCSLWKPLKKAKAKLK